MNLPSDWWDYFRFTHWSFQTPNHMSLNCISFWLSTKIHNTTCTSFSKCPQKWKWRTQNAYIAFISWRKIVGNYDNFNSCWSLNLFNLVKISVLWCWAFSTNKSIHTIDNYISSARSDLQSIIVQLCCPRLSISYTTYWLRLPVWSIHCLCLAPIIFLKSVPNRVLFYAFD